jgi:hypothetical protein
MDAAMYEDISLVWQVPGLGLVMKGLMDNSRLPGLQVLWEWRYIHDHIPIGTKEVWKWISKNIESIMKVMAELQLQQDHFHYSKGVVKHGHHKENLCSTAAVLGVLLAYICFRVPAQTSKSSALSVMLALVSAAVAGLDLLQPHSLQQEVSIYDKKQNITMSTGQFDARVRKLGNYLRCLLPI